MKRLLLIAMTVVCAFQLFAQKECPDTLSIQSAMDAFMSMRDAVSVNDREAIRSSVQNLKCCNTCYWTGLRCSEDTEASLNGHLVFDEIFADSLAAGRDVYDHADDICKVSRERGQTSDGSILTKTCFVKAEASVKYSFYSKGHQELAVVAEAGGLVTMKIRVTKGDGMVVRYDDTTYVHQGLPQRKTSFNLPTDIRNTVELEVINCGKKDITFVVISN